MNWRASGIALLRSAILTLTLLGSSFVVRSSLFAEPSPSGSHTNAQIECVTPDGKLSAIPHSHIIDPNSAGSIIDDATVSCPLREGETTFVIALPNALRDRFTFVNENAAACGELRIAVSDSRLSADSPKWTEEDGIIPFSHKRLFPCWHNRLFNLSVLGVETNYVLLSFHVEGARADSTEHKVAQIPAATFHSSAMASAINSHFVNVHAQRADLAASFGSLSVAPLSAATSK
jgi:hypothetical protein